MLAAVISRRLATDADAPFLARLHRACHWDEFAALGEQTAEPLLAAQFEMQATSYLSRFGPSGSNIITIDDVPVGRIWVHCDESEWLLVDVALLPEHRNAGLGTSVLADLVVQADRHDAALRLSVAADNIGAQRLYFRHGFTVEASTEVGLQMVLRPAGQRAARFESFRRRALADPALFAELSTVGRDGFASAVMAVAQGLGEDIDAADVNTALREARTIWMSRWV